MDSALERNNIEYLLSLSEDEILDKIIELKPECTNYSFCTFDMVSGAFGDGYFNSTGFLPFSLLHNIKELFKSKRNRAKRWINNNYESLKGTICHIPNVRKFSLEQLLYAELVIDLAKSIAQKSGEGLEYATIFAVFLVKEGLQKFCKDEWSNLSHEK